MKGVLIVTVTAVTGALLANFDMASGLMLVIVGGTCGLVLSWIELS